MLPPFSNPEDYDLPVKMPLQYRCKSCGEYYEYIEKAFACCEGLSQCHHGPEFREPSSINPNYIECKACGAAAFKTSAEHLQELLEGYRG